MTGSGLSSSSSSPSSASISPPPFIYSSSESFHTSNIGTCWSCCSNSRSPLKPSSRIQVPPLLSFGTGILTCGMGLKDVSMGGASVMKTGSFPTPLVSSRISYSSDESHKKSSSSSVLFLPFFRASHSSPAPPCFCMTPLSPRLTLSPFLIDPLTP